MPVTIVTNSVAMATVLLTLKRAKRTTRVGYQEALTWGAPNGCASNISSLYLSSSNLGHAISTCSEFSFIPHYISQLGFIAFSLWFLDDARLFWPDGATVICLIVDLFLKPSFP
eukprot:sb/3476857/